MNNQQPDWEIAPVGTTHWEPESHDFTASWMMLKDGQWFYRVPGRTEWMECGQLDEERLAKLIPHPAPLTKVAKPAGPFQIADQLYLALRRVTDDYRQLADSGDAGNLGSDFDEMMSQAADALLSYEVINGHMPDWAIGANGRGGIKPGAQLCTKDGRRCGNAFIIAEETDDLGIEMVWKCLTDAGTVMRLNSNEIHEMFWIGDYLADPTKVLQRFGKELSR